MRSKKGNKRTKKESGVGVGSLLRAAALSLLITLCICLLLLLLAAALLLRLEDPRAATSVAGITVLFVCAVLCGLLTVRLHGRRLPLLCGALAGTLLLLCLCGACAFMPATTARPKLLITLLLHAALPPLAILGAKLGGKEKRRKKIRK
jgi:putative membrane protein (TIGR04086 family)